MEEASNGRLDPPADENEDEPVVGPGPAARVRPKRPLKFEQAFLDTLPSAHMYEKSYMHRDVVTHVAVSAADFLITGSYDGVLLSYSLCGGAACQTINFGLPFGDEDGLT